MIEREIYENIFTDVVDQIEMWMDQGMKPEESPFKKKYWEAVAREMAEFLVEARMIPKVQHNELNCKITRDVNDWVKKKTKKGNRYESRYNTNNYILSV